MANSRARSSKSKATSRRKAPAAAAVSCQKIPARAGSCCSQAGRPCFLAQTPRCCMSRPARTRSMTRAGRVDILSHQATVARQRIGRNRPRPPRSSQQQGAGGTQRAACHCTLDRAKGQQGWRYRSCAAWATICIACLRKHRALQTQPASSTPPSSHWTRNPVSKNGLLSHLYLQTNILPRQARDTRIGKTQKRTRFLSFPKFVPSLSR